MVSRIDRVARSVGGLMICTEDLLGLFRWRAFVCVTAVRFLWDGGVQVGYLSCLPGPFHVLLVNFASVLVSIGPSAVDCVVDRRACSSQLFKVYLDERHGGERGRCWY